MVACVPCSPTRHAEVHPTHRGSRADALRRGSGELGAVVVRERRVVVVEVDRADVAAGLRRRPAGRGSSPSPVRRSAASSGSVTPCAKVSVVVPSASARSISQAQSASVSTGCAARITTRRGGIALVDPDRLVRDVVALGRHPEGDRAARGLAGPLPDPPRQPVGLGDRRPHVLDRRAEGPLEDDVGRLRRAPRGVRSAGAVVVVMLSPRRCGRWWRSRSVVRSLADGAPDLEVEAVERRLGEAGSRLAASASQSVRPAQSGALERGSAARGRGPRADTSPASESTRRCRLMAGRLIGCSAARSTTRAGPRGERDEQVAAHRVGEGGERVHAILVTVRLPICQGLPSSHEQQPSRDTHRTRLPGRHRGPRRRPVAGPDPARDRELPDQRHRPSSHA